MLSNCYRNIYCCKILYTQNLSYYDDHNICIYIFINKPKKINNNNMHIKHYNIYFNNYVNRCLLFIAVYYTYD